MISKKYYQELLSKDSHKRDYNVTENDLFDYIIESESNGQFRQVRDFVSRLSRVQYNGFVLYLQDNNVKLKGCYLK
jgi:hypothetical protein